MLRTVFAVLVTAAVSHAAPKRVVVDAPPALRRAVEAALPKGSAVKGPDVDEKDAASVVSAARAANAVAVVSARVEGKQAVVELLNGSDGASLARVTVKLPKKGALKALPKPAATALTKALASAQPPAAEPAKEPEPPPTPKVAEAPPDPKPADPKPADPKPAETKTADAASAEPTPAPPPEISSTRTEPPAEPARLDVVRVAVGPRVLQRSLSWSDNDARALGSYALPGGPAVAVDAQFFPAALFTNAAIANLGVSASFEESVGIVSTDEQGERYGTSAMRFRVGALWRIPVSRFTFSPHAGWSMQSFTFGTQSVNRVPRVSIPNVRYGTVRAGLLVDVRLAGPLSLQAGGAYQHVLSMGEVASDRFFSRATALGADFEAALAARVTSNLELRLSAEYQRYWLSTHAQPGDPWTASAAVDEYRSILLTAAFVL